MGAREKDLRAPLLAAHVIHIGANAVAVAEVLARQGLVAAHDRLGAAEIDDDIAVLDALHDAVDDFADAVLVLVVLALALGLAHFLHDHLLCVLRGDPAEIERGQGLGDEIADLRRRIAAPRLLERNLGRLHGDGLDHFEQAREPDLAGLGIDLGLDLVLAAVAGLRRLLDRVLHGGDDHLAIDRLLARDRVRDLQELEPVGADACLSHLYVLQSFPSSEARRQKRGRSVHSMCGLLARKVGPEAREIRHKLRLRDQREGKADDDRLNLAVELDPEPHLVLGDPFDHALEPLAPVNQLFQLDLRFVSGP